MPKHNRRIDLNEQKSPAELHMPPKPKPDDAYMTVLPIGASSKITPQGMPKAKIVDI
jgi:hypothetical protein